MDNLTDFQSKAREQGYSWGEINDYLAQKRSQAQAEGYSDDEIDKYLGATNPAPLEKNLSEQARENVRTSAPQESQAATPQTEAHDPWNGFLAGLERSSGGLVASRKLPRTIEPKDAGYATHLAAMAGEAIGDIPGMIAGATLGAGAGAGVPVAGETGASEIVGAGAGGFALPQAIKSGYIAALQSGQVSGPRDFAMRQAKIWWEEAKGFVKGGVTGATTASAGMEAAIASAAKGPITRFVATKSAQLAAMTTVGKALEGQLPSPQDFVDGAILISAAHGVGALPDLKTVRENLGDHWAKTDEVPAQAVQRAQTDPEFQREMVTEKPPTPPEGSSTTKTEGDGNFVIPKVETPEAPPPKEPTAPEGEPPAHDPWASVGSRIAEEPPGKSFVEKAKSMAYDAYTSLFNPQHQINKITRAMRDGGVLDDANNPDFANRIAENSSTRAMYSLEKAATDLNGKKAGPALQEILGRFGSPEERQRFRTYAVARWAVEKADQERETGVDVDDARQVISEGGKAYEKSFQDLVRFQNTTLGWLKDSGVISDDTYRTWVEENRARIPGYREGKQAREVPGSPAKPRQPGNPIKEFMGSERKILPIETSIMRDTFIRAQLADRAYANRITADGAAKMGLATKVGEAPLPKDAVDINPDDHPLDKPDDTLSKIAAQHLAAEEIPVPRNGNIERWVFADPNVARVLRGYDQQELSLLQRIARPFAQFQRSMVVLNPLFAPKILWYDAQFQFLTKPGLRNTPADIVAGSRALFGKDGSDGANRYDEWVRSGGADHVFEWANRNQYIKDYIKGQGDPAFYDGAWNLIKTPIDRLKAWNSAWFAAMRVGRFARGKEAGESDQAAAFASSEAAFHRANWGGPQAKAINAVQPFFAAYLNGLEQTFRAYTGRNFAGDQTLSLKEVGLNHVKALATITPLMLANWWANKDEDWYKAAPAWQRDNGIFIGTNSTGHMYLPFTPLLGFLFGAIPRRVMEAYHEHDPAAFTRDIGEGGLGAFAPPAGAFTMSVLQPVIEHVANYSFFTGRPIQSDTELKMLPPERFTPYSTATAKELGQLLNVPPVVTDNYIRGWFGTVGNMALRYAEMSLGANPKAPTPTWADMPGFSSFAIRYPSATAQPIIDFENKLDEMAQVHGTLESLYKQGNIARFQQVARENPAAALMHNYQMRGTAPPPDAGNYAAALRGSRAYADLPSLRIVAQAEKQLEAQRKVVANISNADPKKLNANDRRQMLDNQYRLMQATAENALKAMKTMNGKQ